MNRSYLILILLLQMLAAFDFYEPLSLKMPPANDYDVPADTFVLCDLSHEFFKTYCLNKGICYTLVDRNRGLKSEAKNTNSIATEIFCSCSNEFTGPRCEIILDQKPKNKTSYVDPIKSLESQLFSSVAAPGASSSSGPSSPSPLPAWQKTSTSANQAAMPTFQHLKNTLKECPKSYKCLNGGTCKVDPFHGAKCACVEGFYGPNCEKNKYCPEIESCKLACDFGYELKNNCEICKCKCITDENYLDEMKKAMKTLSLLHNKDANTSKFCQKPCKNGYVKDHLSCYKCECVESSPSSSQPQPSLPLTSKKPSNLTKNLSGSLLKNQSIPDVCSKSKCNKNEICRLFDMNVYRCPEEIMDCSLYKKSAKVPICVVNNKYNESCTDLLKTGNCHTYTERYYFDIIDKLCKKFYYTGCGGNRNNFASFDECTGTCMRYSNIDIMNTNSLLNEFASTEAVFDHSKLKSQEDFVEPHSSKLSVGGHTTPKLNVTPTKYIDGFKYVTVQTLADNPNKNSYKSASAEIEENPPCQWVCDINCPYGYKMDYKSKCYKCECIDLVMTECGVPCYAAGTHSCLYAQRANSRPKCICKGEYEGVYCHIMAQAFNFSVRVERSIKVSSKIIDEIRINLSRRLSKLLEIGTNHVMINEIKNDPREKIIIRFGINAPDFTSLSTFYEMIETLENMLSRRNLTIRLLNQETILYQICDKSEELFALDLNEKYFLRTDKLKQMIKDLKGEIKEAYKFDSEAIGFVKVKIEPIIQLEFIIRNVLADPDFCKKAFYLQSDIRTMSFSLSKYDAKFLDSIELGEINGSDASLSYKNKLNISNLNLNDSNFNIWDNEESFLSVHNPESNSISHLTTPGFMNHSIVFISVIISSFLILVFLIGLVLITQMRRKQIKDITKISDSYSRVTLDNYDKNSAEFPGYFLPNYATNNRAIINQSTMASSAQKLNLVAY